MMDFIDICKMSEQELKQFLLLELKNYYDEVIDEPGFLYARQINCPVLLTAHMDTVHEQRVTQYFETLSNGKHIISSPQGIGGDDRCGIYMILSILSETTYRPAILFCEQEEKGGIGSRAFCKTKYIEELKELKFFIELDRSNENDLVFYDDDNQDFHQWCEKVTGYYENWGTFSDISHLCPATGIAGVNISCGYYKAHTLNEYVIMEEMENSIDKVIDMLKASEDVEPFKYIEMVYQYKYGKYNTYYNYGKYSKVFLYVTCIENGEQIDVYIDDVSESKCWMIFFTTHPTVCFNDVLDWDVY